MAIAFLEKVRDGGYIPVIYTNLDYMRNYFDLERIAAQLGRMYVWYARYTSSLPDSEARAVDIWQYTASGRIPGVAGRVDMNRFYTDFAESTVQSVVKCGLDAVVSGDAVLLQAQPAL